MACLMSNTLAISIGLALVILPAPQTNTHNVITHRLDTNRCHEMIGSVVQVKKPKLRKLTIVLASSEVFLLK